MLTDNEQKTYTVSRLRNPERSTLEPGGSVVVERIFFDVPKKAQPSKLSFIAGRKPAKTIDI